MIRTRASNFPRMALILGALAMAMCGTAYPQLAQTMHQDGWILAAAHAPGAYGSTWRTDLWFYLRSPAPWGEITLYFCKAGTDNAGAAGHVVAIPVDAHILYLEDVVDQYLGIGGGAWSGAIHYVSTTPIHATARIYSVNPGGTESYGQSLEGIPTADMSPDETPWWSNEHQWLIGIKHTADNRFRVNVGVVNPTATASTYAIEMYDAKGNYGLPGLPKTVMTDVPPFSMVQLTDPFAAVNGGDWADVQVRVVCMSEGGGSFAYASVVDNATNDAYFVRGFKLMTPDEVSPVR